LTQVAPRRAPLSKGLYSNMLRPTYTRFLFNPLMASVNRAPRMPDCNLPVAAAWGGHLEHRKIPAGSAAQRPLERLPQANGQRQLGDQPSKAALLPQLSEINGVSGMYCLSIYTPSAAKKAMMPRKVATAVWFELWKEEGFLHVQAASPAENLLQLAVFVSDGWGFPSRSAILQMWQRRGCDRWAAFKNYLPSGSRCWCWCCSFLCCFHAFQISVAGLRCQCCCCSCCCVRSLPLLM